GSKVIIKKGTFNLGFPLPKTIPYSTYNKTTLFMGENSTIICEGNVLIAPGATIRVKDNATLIFKGDDIIAHNFTLICSKEVEFGKNVNVSWNNTFIDHDEHFIWKNDRKIKPFFHPLKIGNNVGIQMNVLIPRGVTIGDGSVVSCGTTIRKNIPARSLVYHNPELVIKDGFHYAGYVDHEADSAKS
ncbi:MAG: hypothetical protein KAQ98_11675, partial [Bacteriovoracaceae bacterium]|nr:hypothetical protein [Bacteriovoracaceae bacterium]